VQEVEALARKRGSQGLDHKVARESGTGDSAVAVSSDGLVTFGAEPGQGGVTVNVQTLSHRSAEVRDRPSERDIHSSIAAHQIL